MMVAVCSQQRGRPRRVLLLFCVCLCWIVCLIRCCRSVAFVRFVGAGAGTGCVFVWFVGPSVVCVLVVLFVGICVGASVSLRVGVCGYWFLSRTLSVRVVVDV